MSLLADLQTKYGQQLANMEKGRKARTIWLADMEKQIAERNLETRQRLSGMGELARHEAFGTPLSSEFHASNFGKQLANAKQRAKNSLQQSISPYKIKSPVVSKPSTSKLSPVPENKPATSVSGTNAQQKRALAQLKHLGRPPTDAELEAEVKKVQRFNAMTKRKGGFNRKTRRKMCA